MRGQVCPRGSTSLIIAGKPCLRYSLSQPAQASFHLPLIVLGRYMGLLVQKINNYEIVETGNQVMKSDLWWRIAIRPY